MRLMQQDFVRTHITKDYMKGVEAMSEDFKISLAAARVNAGMTQNDVAEKLKVSKNTIVAWENGSQEPKVETARRLSEMFNMPLDYIKFGT